MYQIGIFVYAQFVRNEIVLHSGVDLTIKTVKNESNYKDEKRSSNGVNTSCIHLCDPCICICVEKHINAGKCSF